MLCLLFNCCAERVRHVLCKADIVDANSLHAVRAAFNDGVGTKVFVMCMAGSADPVVVEQRVWKLLRNLVCEDGAPAARRLDLVRLGSVQSFSARVRELHRSVAPHAPVSVRVMLLNNTVYRLFRQTDSLAPTASWQAGSGAPEVIERFTSVPLTNLSALGVLALGAAASGVVAYDAKVSPVKRLRITVEWHCPRVVGTFKFHGRVEEIVGGMIGGASSAIKAHSCQHLQLVERDSLRVSGVALGWATGSDVVRPRYCMHCPSPIEWC
jgi:hypothetical protein